MVIAFGTLGPIGLLAIGGSLIFAMMSYVKKVDELLKAENLTNEQKTGAIKVISALAVMSSIASAVKTMGGDVVAATLFGMLFSFMTMSFMALAEFFNTLPTLPDKKITPDY
jgi:energy-converting hydrogenase Eha subunit H